MSTKIKAKAYPLALKSALADSRKIVKKKAQDGEKPLSLPAVKKATATLKKTASAPKQGVPSIEKSMAIKNGFMNIDTFSTPARFRSDLKENENHFGAARAGGPAARKTEHLKKSDIGSDTGKKSRTMKQEDRKTGDKTYLPVSNYKISSPFGVDRGDHVHSGIDLAVAEGTPVAAVKNGAVVFAGWSNGYGYRIVIDHGDGTRTTYNHLSDIGVTKGEQVGAGAEIALSGNTGNSTGPHLHFEVIVGGAYVNPESYFDFGNGIVALADSNYTSKLPSAQRSKATASSTSSSKASAASSSARLGLPDLAAGVKTSDRKNSGELTLPKMPTQFSPRQGDAVNYFDDTPNPLLLLIPAYNSGKKKGRTTVTQPTKRV